MGCINPFCTALLNKLLEEGLPLPVYTHRHAQASVLTVTQTAELSISGHY